MTKTELNTAFTTQILPEIEALFTEVERIEGLIVTLATDEVGRGNFTNAMGHTNNAVMQKFDSIISTVNN